MKLADLIGAQQSNVARYESGVQTPRVDAALRMARILGTTVEEIWGTTSFGHKAEEQGSGAGGQWRSDAHDAAAAGPGPDQQRAPAPLERPGA